MTLAWKSLQNGSDIRGIALAGVPGEEVNLSNDVAGILGRAFFTWLIEKELTNSNKAVIGVGMDSRISGPEIKKSFIAGLMKQGAHVLDFGLATTPAMFMATKFEKSKCDGAVMITASHLPPNRNGFKFFTPKAGLDKKDIRRLLEIAEANSFSIVEKGSVEDFNIISPYAQFIINFVRKGANNTTPLKGLKIVLDAGNGAGGFFADKILEPLGADTEGSIFLNPDGNFPNHAPNPENKDAIIAVTNAVVKNKADLGIIFDTDVDRAAVVDKSGKPINRNSLIALMSTIILKEHPNSIIVTDSVTSEGLTEFITKNNGIHHRFKRGYKNVINESIRLNKEGKKSWLAIETSGHAALKENNFLDDGAFLVAKVLIELARITQKNKTLSDLIVNLKQAIESEEFRIKITADDFNAYGESVISKLEEYVTSIEGWELEKINYEGLRIRCLPAMGNGWFLLRLSLHDPVLPLNIESNNIGGINIIANKLQSFFDDFKELVPTSLSIQ